MTKTIGNAKIIILSASFGDGHMQVSRALEKIIREKGIKQVKIIDLLAEAHPIFNKIMRKIYMKSCSLTPSLYGWSYYLTKYVRYDTKLSKWLHSIGMRKMREIFNKERPDLIIQTFSMMTMSELRKKVEIPVPIFSVLTDFDLHNKWLHSEIDKYFVATEDLQAKMVATGIQPQKITVSGIPIRDTFYKPCDVSKILEKYGLDPHKKTVLIIAGAFGITKDARQICESLLIYEKLQIVLVCGKNEALAIEMKQAFSQHSPVHVFGFVEQIHELMAVSSCMVSKAGGITLSEALVTNLPLILFRPIPGQELENAQYFESKGAAVVVRHASEVPGEIQKLFSEEFRLETMKKTMNSLIKGNAAEIVINEIIKYLEAYCPQEEGLERRLLSL